MDTILFLAQTEEDGTLAKPALEALGAAVDLNQALGGTLVAAFTEPRHSRPPMPSQIVVRRGFSRLREKTSRPRATQRMPPLARP